jgi:hypothetical protein
VERYGFGFALLEGSGYGTELANFVPGRGKRFAVEEDKGYQESGRFSVVASELMHQWDCSWSQVTAQTFRSYKMEKTLTMRAPGSDVAMSAVAEGINI